MSTTEFSGFSRGIAKTYEIPVDHLDYKFIEKCTDVKHLEKVLRVLRSGEEGHYPDLTAFCERRIESLSPSSRALRKDKPPATAADFTSEDWQHIASDFRDFLTEIKLKEQEKCIHEQKINNLPPVRSFTTDPPPHKPKGKENRAGGGKVPRDYREWDRFDVEKELSKAEESPENSDQSKTVTNAAATKINKSVDTSGLSSEQKSILAEREKEKGNEAFRSGDYEEAIMYYSRSISIVPSAGAYNNRAQAEIKLKNWHNAMNDCKHVLRLEPGNMKAHLRRATVNKNLKHYQAAVDDLKTVLHHEPDNPIAQKFLCEVEKLLQKETEEKPRKGRKIIIQDVEDSDEENKKSHVAEEAGVTAGGGDAAAAALTDMGNAQKKFPIKRPNERRDEANQTPRHSKPGNANGLRRDSGSPEAKPSLEHSSNAPPVRTSIQETEPSPASLPPAARLKAQGNQLFKNGQFAEAALRYTEAIENLRNTGDEDAEELGVLYSNRAACHLKDGNSSQCIEDCNKALELQPFSIKPLLRRAMAFESLERYRQAYVDYKVALQIDSGMQLANDSINRITKTLIDLDGASWREKLPPIPSVPLSSQIHLQERQSAPARTSNNVRPGSESGKSTEETFLSLKKEGNDYVKKSQYKEAVRKYTECLQIDPEECTIYTNRALCYLKLCQYEEARHDCDCALQRDPANIKALYRRAQAYKGLENYQDCASDLQKVISLDSGVTEAKNLLVEITPFLSNGIKEKQRKKVLIKEVNENEENTPSQNILNGHGRKLTQISKPMNAFEFEQLMNAIRAGKDREGCAQLLSVMDPKDLPKFLGNNLDTETLLLITQSLKEHHLEENPTLVYQHLSHLSTARRFKIILSLLKETEKEDLQDLIRHLLEKQSNSLAPDAMLNLTNQYEL
ncbi:sperm-associated antigen 1 [Hyperolius riggenbachi]|uniref:sperm-associated antigen 1 n=1 Tax=Hyperolius riggenbachi TaxID=752182 RepID=UPI0035A3A07C